MIKIELKMEISVDISDSKKLEHMWNKVQYVLLLYDQTVWGLELLLFTLGWSSDMKEVRAF